MSANAAKNSFGLLLDSARAALVRGMYPVVVVLSIEELQELRASARVES